MSTITDEYMGEMRTKTKAYTVLFLKAGPNRWMADVDKVIWEHGRRNFSLRADGVLSIVCPITDDTDWCGVSIFDATPEEAARIMDDDPGVKAGVFTCEVHPIRSFPGDCLPI